MSDLVVPTDKPHISPSQIETYLRCGELYRRRYLCHEKIPPGVALIKGSSVHKGAEENFRQKVDSRRDLPKQRIVDYAVACLDDRAKADGVLLTEEEQATGKSKVLGQVKDSVAALTGLYADEVAPAYQPVAAEVEQRVVLTTSPRDLLTRLDLVDDQRQVIELKTGTKSFNQEDVDRNFQLTFESLAYRAIHKAEPSGIVVEQLVDLKAPKRLQFKTARTREDYVAGVNVINAAITGIEASHFPPALPGSWYCSPKWCGYWSTCPYVNSERRAAARAVADP